MIPDFDERGYLPAGVHPATLAEIEERFGRGSEIRQAQFESVCWLIDIARLAGVKRIVLNGSFVTDAVSPNDADCLLLIDEGFPAGLDAGRELREGLPFLDIELADKPTFDFYVSQIYSTDRFDVEKGMIEVLI